MQPSTNPPVRNAGRGSTGPAEGTPPPPADDKSLLNGGGHHDALIAWLALNEAQGMLGAKN